MSGGSGIFRNRREGVFLKWWGVLTPLRTMDLLKSLPILSDTAVRKSAVDRKDLKSYWKSEKR